MNRSIPFLTSQVAGVSVADINASGTQLTSGNGASYTFGGLVLSQSGEPFKAHAVTASNISSLLGAAQHPSKGAGAMSLRYVKEAVGASSGIVVPVVGTDARRPVIALKSATPATDPNIAVARVVPFGTEVEPDFETQELCVIYPVDGDVSDRKLSLTPNTSKSGYFTIKLVKTYPNGGEDIQLEREVSFDTEALDEYGQSAYIVDVLSGSNRLNIVIDQSASPNSFVSLAEVAFTGGTRGDLNNIELAQYQKAVSVLRNDSREFTAIVGMGISDASIIKELQAIAANRRVDAFFDVPSHLSYADALTWMNDNAFESKESCFYHLPYAFDDLYFRGSKAVWGLSAIAFGAKVKAVNSVGGTIGGYHISPAGVERGVVTRGGAEVLPDAGEPNFESMVDARINKVVPHDGRLIIDDAITATGANNYMRFQHIVSLFHAISRRFYQGVQSIKHQPDGVTVDALTSLMKSIGEDFVSVDALRTPRDLSDGDQPFVFEFEQKDIDLWHVHWFACPTGVARRIAGFPTVVR